MKIEERKQRILDRLKTQNNFEMFTASGNKKIKAVAKAGIKKVFSRNYVDREMLIEYLGDKLGKVAIKHEEALDTEPPGHIVYWVNTALREQHYTISIDRWDLSDAAFEYLKS